MRQNTSTNDFDELTPLLRLFWALWKMKKGYPPEKECTYGQIMELALALPGGLRYDTSVRKGDDEIGEFNNVLDGGEFLLGFDGSQPIESAWYYVNSRLKPIIYQSVAGNE